MPTYQYRCTECGHDLEAVQKFSDAALTECPDCGGRLRKVFNAVGVVFKGSRLLPHRQPRRFQGREVLIAARPENPGADTKSPDKEPAGTKSAGSNNSGNGKQPISNGSSSTGTKATSS